MFLVSKGLGTLGTNIGTEYPPTPDDFLTVRQYGGEPPERTKDGASIRYPRFQVSARSKSARAAAMRAESAYQFLHGFSGLMNNTGYRVRALDEPAPLGRDEDGRERVICNYLAW